MRIGRILLVAAPAWVIGVLGLAHPVFLTTATADRWQLVHLVLLPLFPLVAGSVLWLVRGDRSALAWVARVCAYGYTVLYGALDSIAGIGAPQQVRNSPRPPIGDLFEIGDRLGHVGVVLLAVAGLATGLLLWLRHRSPLALAGGAVLALACLPFYRHHVFPSRGVLAMLGIGVGLALLAAAQERAAHVRGG
ncbi:MAG: hypothetical protein LC789_02810 [Actinobacteria bacterium]|nr:hypothetical protein [Actinomycetota bacterium]MCA1721205.1 hypothetical protein [Actinomycetota bacterium]